MAPNKKGKREVSGNIKASQPSGNEAFGESAVGEASLGINPNVPAEKSAGANAEVSVAASPGANSELLAGESATSSNILTEGVDFTVENGLFVWTRHYLAKRGFCCHSGCRNCPYQDKVKSP